MKKQKYVQTDMFAFPKSENDYIWESLQSLQDSHNSVRKRIFHETQELKELLIETRANYNKILWHLGIKEEEEKTAG